ncbi:PREDICTED: probable ATP-dependent RNA helicase DDX20 [Hipposideros armiger]|uniref:Probable ATP-dependent RNA helicase DDX20 n=1 Tax=Hipposideros armiger TaxID=186990 RepID=A0A8B7Q3F9_HIPAR|nr:PREDICTED: probable ATP-dependent RNA helicase DDX20 [Hipposideros armiger]XP_019482986.1 PREDICTED: probable ATP-dependent RNA helicase DDX20 [Hipposideros armiger]
MAAPFEAAATLATVETVMPTEHMEAQVSAPDLTPEPVRSLRTAHDVSGPRTRTGDVLLAEPADFESLLLSRPVLEGLRAAGFERPSPVQLKAIPLGRCGLDLIVQAKSGTGKTCVFSTIALDALALENLNTQILILAPTREIAVQIHSVITTIGIKMEGLECHVFIGGTPLSQDKTRLKKCHIAVGSPGRIKQLIELDYLNTGSIRLFILDEADKLLEEGSFQEQINWIYSSLPASKQMLAVSATYPEFLANALTMYMRDPTFIRLNSSDPSLIGLKQYYKVVSSYPLAHKIFEEKAQHLQELFSRIPFNQALVFSNLHSRAQHLADILSSKGFPAECISGNMNQSQRLDAMAKLKQFHCRVLISTDLTSRGIDAEKVNLVVNLDVPLDWETYMHRIGRAGRFGTLGLSVTYCCRGEEENMMMKIAQKCNINLLPLPDPIPPGLMEDCLDWDVEVKAAVHTYGLESMPTKPLKKQIPKLEGNSQTQKAHGNHMASSRNTSVSALSVKSKNNTKQKLPVKSRSECGIVEKAAPAAALGCAIPSEKQRKHAVQTLGENSDRSQHQAPDVPESLPQIPCLSSFKTHLPCALTFAELVGDYEHYIKEGLERSVEIIRHYTGPGDQTGNPRNGFVRNRITEERVQVLAGSGQSGDSESDSDSYSSRTSSQSKGNKSYVEGSSDAQLKDLESTPVDGHVPLEQPLHGNDTPNLREYQESPDIQMKAQHKEGASQRAKQSRRTLPRRSSCRRQTEPQEDGGGYDHHQEPPVDFSGTYQDYEEYWRAYYRAWQEYYSTAAQSYYWNAQQRHPGWMAAYHMNTAYLQELMRGNQ